jgi:hypothetical protein
LTARACLGHPAQHHRRRHIRALDGGFRLRVNGEPFQPFDRGPRIGREVVIGPATLSGIEVTRKVFVPRVTASRASSGSSRTPTRADIEVPVRIEASWVPSRLYQDVLGQYRPARNDRQLHQTDDEERRVDPR